MKTEELIQQLMDKVAVIRLATEKYSNFDLEVLQTRERKDSWNILECFEHLNLYGDYYLPMMQKQIAKSHHSASSKFKSGWLGAYFSKSMVPKKKLNKMKTFRDKNPLHLKLDRSTIDKFNKQLDQLEILLQKAKNCNLVKIKVPTSISSLIKMSLGDTFQFYLNHILRHVNQMERIEAHQFQIMH